MDESWRTILLPSLMLIIFLSTFDILRSEIALFRSSASVFFPTLC